MHHFSARALLVALAVAATAVAGPLELKPRDRIAVIGNTLADRMQHDAWLDAYLHTRFPTHDFTFRHMGFAADELTVRLRSAGFGSPDEWLNRVRADVVFAFFGYNESFAGPAGLNKFKKDLDAFVKHTTAQKYSREANARLVLFSPIAHETIKDANLPDGAANNQRLELYAAAMAEVARSNGVAFVDLYHPTRDLYTKSLSPLTINGIHLNVRGNELVAREIDRALFGDEPKRETANLDKVRRAAAERNSYWFNRYRTTDGYSIYGGRADLKFVDGQSNRVVAEREMEVLDALTENRDKKTWAAARGQDLTPDDKNTPPFIPVVTNKPGGGPNGEHILLSGDFAITRMKVEQGLKVSLFADERMFPELAKPVQMAWDTKGRLWVAVWPSYPHWKPKDPMDDKLLIFEDTDSDGQADKMTVFADNLHNPTGFEFYNGGVIVAHAPDLLFLKDTNGDDKADTRVTLISGIDSADTHHTANSFTLDPGGALYFQEGTFHHTQVETPYGPPVRCVNAGVFRYEPRTQKFDTYVSFGFANPHGHVFDRWGQDIVVDGTGAVPYHGTLFSGHLNFPEKHRQPPTVYKQRTRPCPSMEYAYSKHFPDGWWGNLLVANVIGFQGILRYKIEPNGGSLKGTELEPVLSSSDPNFRPSDLKIGPDGALYFIDWHNPIIGHMQHNLRDPSRDRKHGRIYKVTHQGRELVKPERIAGEPLPRLLDLLKSPEDRVRYRVRIELGARKSADVITATKTWLAGLETKDADFAHQQLEGLWVHQQHDAVDVNLLKSVLSSNEPNARAAATRVLCYWRDRVPGALDLLKKRAADPHPLVRVEAVRAASFFTMPEAVEIPLIAQAQAADPFVDFVRGETMRALEPLVKAAIASGKPIEFTTAAGAEYFVKNVGTDDLMRMKRSSAVYAELLFRKGVRDEFRREALRGLAADRKKSELRVLIDAIKEHDTQEGTDVGVAFDLVRILTDQGSQLAEVRGDLESLAMKAKAPITRQLGYVALIAADRTPDKAWALAAKSTGTLKDLVNAIPLIRDVSQRLALYPRIVPLLEGLPAELAARQPKGPTAISGQFIRIDLPGKQRTLTLAEVEVYSDGVNVARQGKAKQSSTAHGGEAKRGIDGNTSPRYPDGGQTHSREGEDNPWWEVDLGREFPIERIMVFNRADGALGTRLKDYTLTVLDGDRKPVFDQKFNPPPNPKTQFILGHESPERVIRRAAMLGLTSVRGKEADSFKSIARFVKDDAERPAAVQALLRIPSAEWPKEDANGLIQTLVAAVRKVPVAERTTPAALDFLQFAEALAALLPPEQGRAVRKELGEIGVRVLRVGTLTDQMQYDKDRMVVQAGKPVEFLFENTDIMPHNFVILLPGSLEEVGNAAEAAATQPGALERHYVPQSPKVILKSQLLQPRDSERLAFTAPTTPGIYPYVCTYPGHWRRMYGALYVVADLEAYQTAAEEYLARNPLPVKDELLKYNRPRTEWKFVELAPEVEKMTIRSFATGKQIFTVASCVSCHKLNGVGQEIGQDLTKLDPKIDKPAEILRHILEPSLKIDDKYQSWTFDLLSGKKITGMVLEQKDGVYKVIENPLAKADPMLIKESEIDTKTKSPNSIMPKGLLDKLTKEEILDLVAYLFAKGDAKHPLFAGGHHHH